MNSVQERAALQNQMNPGWIEVTQKFRQASSKLTITQILAGEKFSLEDSTNSTQIGFPRIDYRASISEDDCPHLLLLKGKLSPSLPREQINSTFKLLLGKMMLWLSGYSLAKSIYSAPHLYIYKDPEIQLFKAACLQFYQLIRQACIIKDDNYSPSVISFQPVDIDDLVLPKTKLAKFLRALKTMSSELSKKSPRARKNQTLLAIETCRKRFQQLRPELQAAQDLQHLCNPDYSKSLLCSFNPLKYKTIDFAQWTTDFTDMLTQLEFALRVNCCDDIYDVIDGLCQFSKLKRNHLVKSFMFASIYSKEGFFSSEVSFRSFLQHGISLFGKVQIPSEAQLAFLKKQQEANQAESIDDQMKIWQSSVLLLQKLIYFLICNRMKLQRAFTKVYDSVSYSVHFTLKCNKGNKLNTVYSWLTKLGSSLAYRQLAIGTQLDLYSQNQSLYMFYINHTVLSALQHFSKYLEGALRIKTSQVESAFLNSTINAKLKKKVGLPVIKQYVEIQYIYCLKSYYQCCFGLLSQIESVRWTQSQQQTHFNTRIMSFRGVYFIKGLTYSDFIQSLKIRIEILDLLKVTAKKIKSISELDKDLFYGYIDQDINQLKKLCVQTGLNAMRIQKGLKLFGKLKISEGSGLLMLQIFEPTQK